MDGWTGRAPQKSGMRCIYSSVSYAIRGPVSFRSSILIYLSGVALRYGLDESRQGLGIFLFTTASRLALGPTKPPLQWVPGDLSKGVKRPRREADHSPSSAEVKNEWSYTSTPQYTFMAWCSVKAQGQLYFYLFHRHVS
jgi:hypothetical protein